MSSRTKQTEVYTNNVSGQNKMMNNTFSALPFKLNKQDDMITSRAIEESLPNDIISSPKLSE